MNSFILATFNKTGAAPAGSQPNITPGPARVPLTDREKLAKLRVRKPYTFTLSGPYQGLAPKP